MEFGPRLTNRSRQTCTIWQRNLRNNHSPRKDGQNCHGKLNPFVFNLNKCCSSECQTTDGFIKSTCGSRKAKTFKCTMKKTFAEVGTKLWLEGVANWLDASTTMYATLWGMWVVKTWLANLKLSMSRTHWITMKSWENSSQSLSKCKSLYLWLSDSNYLSTLLEISHYFNA